MSNLKDSFPSLFRLDGKVALITGGMYGLNSSHLLNFLSLPSHSLYSKVVPSRPLLYSILLYHILSYQV